MSHAGSSAGECGPPVPAVQEGEPAATEGKPVPAGECQPGEPVLGEGDAEERFVLANPSRPLADRDLGRMAQDVFDSLYLLNRALGPLPPGVERLPDESDVRRLMALLDFKRGELNPRKSLQESDVPPGVGGVHEVHDASRFWVVCDGPIGCGKTTFLSALGNPEGVEVVIEPVSKTARGSWWKMLELLYQRLQERLASANKTQGDREGGAAFEVEHTIWRHHYANATRRWTQHLITERSYESKVKVFSKVLCESPLCRGLLNPVEYGAFVAASQELARDFKRPDLILYFKVPVETAKGRIDKRVQDEGRYFEEGMDVRFLQELTHEYDRLYLHRNDVVEVNADEEKRDFISEVREKVQQYLKDPCPEEKKAKVQAFLACLPDLHRG